MDIKKDKEYKNIEYLIVKDLDIRNGISVVRLDVSYLPSAILPKVSSDNGAVGIETTFARADHSHPKAIASEDTRGEIIIATQNEVNEETDDTKAITSLKNKVYFNNSFDARQATDEELTAGQDIKKYINPKQFKTFQDEVESNFDVQEEDINTLEERVDNLESGRANIDLSNLSTTGQAIISNKANIDLDNITNNGENVIKSIIDENVLNINVGNITNTGKTNIINLLAPDWSRLVGLSQVTQYTFEEGGYLILWTGTSSTNNYIGFKSSLDNTEGTIYSYICSSTSTLQHWHQYIVQTGETITREAVSGTYGAYFLPFKGTPTTEETI